MNDENRPIVSYDPNTGQPIYEKKIEQPIEIMNDISEPIKPSDNKPKNNKILIITNIITGVLLIVFVVAFLLKGGNTKSVDPEKTDNNDYVSTATNKPVSKNWKDYQFSIGGKTLTLPCSYKEFAAISKLSLKSSDEKSYLEGNSSIYVNLYTNDKQKLAIYTDLKNYTNRDMKYTDTKIARIAQTRYMVEINGAEPIVFPGNFKILDEITPEEVKNILGEPSRVIDDLNEYETIKLIYNGNTTYSTINYYEISIYKGKIDSITLDHKNVE